MDTFSVKVTCTPLVSMLFKSSDGNRVSLSLGFLRSHTTIYYCTLVLNSVLANGVTDDKEQWFFNPMLWPFLADPEDLRCLPRCRTIVMQCDIARDMGMAMHERIRAVRVPSSCSMVAGAVHQQHLFTKHSPEITDESIHDLARFATFVKQNTDA